MSTTVSYKGNTIATVDNATKTLNTQGKYLEADVVLTDVSGSTPTPWGFRGEDWELWQTVHDESVTLSAAGFDSWTASTSASTIRASGDTASTYTLDMANYSYLLEWYFQFTAAYNSGATLKAIPIRTIQTFHTYITRRPSTLATMATSTANYNFAGLITTIPFLNYYNTSGGSAMTWSTTYTVYGAHAAPTLSSTTSATPTLTPKYPAITARCNASYFATARKADIDSTNSIVRIVGKLYRAKTNALRQMYDEVVDLYNNPIT